MKLTISKSELQKALDIVMKGVSSNATLPVLSGVYAKVVGDEVQFQTTNYELSVQYTAAAMVEEEGVAVFPGRIISSIVKNLPDAAVHIETADLSAVITCDSASFSIRCLDPIDFPDFPQVQPEQQITVPFDTFREMARKVHRVVSRDESRVILTGVLIEVENQTLKLVATDSYRLAVAETPLEAGPTGQASVDGAEFSAVLAGKFVADLASLTKTGEEISIALAENQVIATCTDTVFVNRRIEGKYPNYRQLLPASCATTVRIDRPALVDAIKRASLLNRTGSQVRFSVNTATQTVQISTSQDAGSTQEILKAQVEGEDVEVGFNSYYVEQGLSVMESPEVTLETQSSMKPGIFRGAPDEHYLYLVMPVRL